MCSERLQVYKCNVCGIVAEILDGGAGQMVCCGEAMALLRENTTDGAREKHVPVIEAVGDGVKVKIGSIPHPMEEKHFIEWIEVIAGGKAYRRFLKPGAAPEAVFELKAGEIKSAREYCNIHGLWKS